MVVMGSNSVFLWSIQKQTMEDKATDWDNKYKKPLKDIVWICNTQMEGGFLPNSILYIPCSFHETSYFCLLYVQFFLYMFPEISNHLSTSYNHSLVICILTPKSASSSVTMLPYLACVWHHTYSQYFYLLLKIETSFCLTHQYIKSTQGKLPIYSYLQQTWQCTKRVFITQELRSTIIYQQPLKIYLVIRINSN